MYLNLEGPAACSAAHFHSNTKDFLLTLTVSIIEDDAQIRAHLVDLINASNRCDLMGSASNGAEAKVLISQNKTDVYLVDLALPDADGVDLIALIKSSCPAARSLVLSTFGDSKHINRSIRAGASGYLLKEEANLALIEKIVTLHNGESPVSASLVKLLFGQISFQDQKKREQQKLCQIFSRAQRDRSHASFDSRLVDFENWRRVVYLLAYG